MAPYGSSDEDDDEEATAQVVKCNDIDDMLAPIISVHVVSEPDHSKRWSGGVAQYFDTAPLGPCQDLSKCP